MKSAKKRMGGTYRLHAALAETDPGSSDLILLDPAGFLPAFRPAPLPAAPGFRPHASSLPCARAGGAPASRPRIKRAAFPR